MEKFVKNLKRGGLPTRCWLYMLILLLSFGLPESIFAQTDLVKVTGTVTDETNQPVPGVNVLLKGSSNIGTVTDIEGKYTLNIPKDATLIFKFVGYKTTEVAVNGKTTVNLSIQPDVKQLEDVVVIGYQAIKREKSTAAIASVAGEKIENIPVPSVEMALQGKVAGLNVLNIIFYFPSLYRSTAGSGICISIIAVGRDEIIVPRCTITERVRSRPLQVGCKIDICLKISI
mgnify:CR=1 FL=1